MLSFIDFSFFLPEWLSRNPVRSFLLLSLVLSLFSLSLLAVTKFVNSSHAESDTRQADRQAAAAERARSGTAAPSQLVVSDRSP